MITIKKHYESQDQYNTIMSQFINEAMTIVDGRYYEWLHSAQLTPFSMYRVKYAFIELFAIPQESQRFYLCMN